MTICNYENIYIYSINGYRERADTWVSALVLEVLDELVHIEYNSFNSKDDIWLPSNSEQLAPHLTVTENYKVYFMPILTLLESINQENLTTGK